MLKRLWAALRQALTGRRLNHAIDRNQQAANDLDMLLKEVLRR